jgi:hypothetical protein
MKVALWQFCQSRSGSPLGARSNKPKADGLERLIYNSGTWLGAAAWERPTHKAYCIQDLFDINAVASHVPIKPRRSSVLADVVRIAVK